MKNFFAVVTIPMPVRRGALLVCRIAVSALALWFAFGRGGLTDLSRAMVAAGALPLATTLTIYLTSQVISALRWLLIARAAGFALRPRTAVSYYFMGMFFNFLGPSLLGGDVARSLYLARGRGGMARAGMTVAFDRYVGFVWLAVLGSVAQLVFGGFSLPDRLMWATHALAVIALVSWLVLPWLGAERIPRGFFRIRSTASVISLVFHLVQIGGAIVLARAVAPTTAWRYCFVFHPLVAIVSALPVSVAGLGVRESGYVYFLASLQGVPASQARVFAAAWLAVVVSASLIGGIVFLASGGRLPRELAGDATRDHSAQLPPSS